MLDGSRRQYQFGDFILEVAERRLLRMKLDRVELTGKPFELLVYLVEHPGQLVTRDTLLDAIWGQTNVSDSSLHDAISRVRKALDPQNPQAWIHTVSGQGYRFVGTVETLRTPPRVAPTVESAAIDRTGRWKFFLGLAVFLAALAGLIAWHVTSRHKQAGLTLYASALQSERSGDDALAIAQLRQILAADPNDEQAKIRIAWILYQDNQNEEAARFLAAQGKSEHVKRAASGTELRAAALQAMLTGTRDEAQQQLELALESDPKSVETLEFLIENEINRLQLEAALAHVARCLDLDPTNPFCYFEKLEILTRNNDFNGALAAFKFAMSATGNYPWLHEQAGYAYLGLNKFDLAQQEFEELREAGKKMANAVYFRASQDGLAQVFLIQERYDEATGVIEDALSRSSSISDTADYHLFLAGVQGLQGRFGEARIQVSLACPQSTCGDDELLNGAVRILILARDFKGARTILGDLRKGPLSQSDDLLGMERFLDGSEALFVGHDAKASVRLLKDAWNADAGPIVLYILAKAQEANDDPEGARESLQELIQGRGDVLLDSFACLLPLADKDLHELAAKSDAK